MACAVSQSGPMFAPRSPVLLPLLSDGSLSPGTVLSVKCNDRTFTATLLACGNISSSQHKHLFGSPSQWICNVKESSDVGANLADDSWGPILYNGEQLSNEQAAKLDGLTESSSTSHPPVQPSVTLTESSSGPPVQSSLVAVEPMVVAVKSSPASVESEPTTESTTEPTTESTTESKTESKTESISPPMPSHQSPTGNAFVDLSMDSSPPPPPPPHPLASSVSHPVAQNPFTLSKKRTNNSKPSQSKKTKKPKKSTQANKPARKRKSRPKQEKEATKAKKPKSANSAVGNASNRTSKKVRKRKKLDFYDSDGDYKLSDGEISEIEIIDDSDGSDYEVRYNKGASFNIYSGASTPYRNNRPKRARKEVSYKDYRLVDQHPLTLLDCGVYKGKPGDGEENSQPYSIVCAKNATLFMDFHAHLATTEIIGLLAGSFDPEAKVVRVETAFACRTLKTGDDTFNVEMDPESEVEVRALIKSADLSVVGWYHSHPHFAPKPSMRDVENQQNYQQIFEDRKQNPKPFVGAIVAPYDTALDGFESHITWFRTEKDVEDILGHEMPMCLAVDYQSSQSEVPQKTTERLNGLIGYYKTFESRADFQASWRESKFDVLYKLGKSMQSRLPSDFNEEQKTKFVNDLCRKIKTEWNL